MASATIPKGHQTLAGFERWKRGPGTHVDLDELLSGLEGLLRASGPLNVYGTQEAYGRQKEGPWLGKQTK